MTGRARRQQRKRARRNAARGCWVTWPHGFAHFSSGPIRFEPMSDTHFGTFTNSTEDREPLTLERIAAAWFVFDALIDNRERAFRSMLLGGDAVLGRLPVRFETGRR